MELKKELYITPHTENWFPGYKMDTQELLKTLELDDEKLEDIDLAKLLDEINYLTIRYVGDNLESIINETIRTNSLDLKYFIKDTKGQPVNNYGENIQDLIDYIIKNQIGVK